MKYRRSIFTFLDVLGFRELVRTKTVEEIGELLRRLQEHAKPDELNAEILEMSFQTFSDSTVRAVPLDSPSNVRHPTGILFSELFDLVHAQYRLVVDGYFMRGGVTIVDICFDGSMVFGPAMVKGYGLESEFAVYPRIVVDPAVFVAHEGEPLLRNAIHDAAAEQDVFVRLVHKDSDGIYFIDYLRGMIGEFDDEGAEFDFFATHKQRILENAAEHKEFSKVAAKYLWLTTYHNSVMREVGKGQFTKYGLDIDDYMIAKDEMPLAYELPDRRRDGEWETRL